MKRDQDDISYRINNQQFINLSIYQFNSIEKMSNSQRYKTSQKTKSTEEFKNNNFQPNRIQIKELPSTEANSRNISSLRISQKT